MHKYVMTLFDKFAMHAITHAEVYWIISAIMDLLDLLDSLLINSLLIR